MEITEEWVRGLTGWKPFKDGKAMAGQGLVTGLKESGGLFQASLREGKLKLRPAVKVVGPTDVRVQCGCADHRSTGGVCAHAVAVLLASLNPAAPAAASPGSSAAPRPTPSAPPQAWEILLSPRFEAEWSAGKLAVRILPSQEAVSPLDVGLSDWLASKELLSGARPLALRLAGSDAAEFLDLVAGHPRVAVEGRPGRFRLDPEPGPPLRLKDSRLEGSQVVLELSPEEPRRHVVRWGDYPAVVASSSIQRLPGRSAEPGWLERVMELAENGRLKLSIQSFVSRFDAWLDLFEPPHPGWLGSLRLAGGEPDFELDLDGSLEGLDAILRVRYPGQSARPLPEADEALPGLPCLAPDGHLLTRDLAAEKLARDRLIRLGFEPGSGTSRFRIRGRDAVLGLIADGLPDLRQRWTVREGERFASVASRIHVVRPEILQTADHGTSLMFELSFQTSSGKRLPGAELRRILRGGKRSVRLAGGSDLVISRSCEELVNPLVEELGIGRPDEPIQLQGAAAILFQTLRDKLAKPRDSNGLCDNQELELPTLSVKGLSATLRSYQAAGSAWLTDRLNRLGGALLADEMGLGKTIQTIASINHLKHSEDCWSGPCLVVAPTSLLGNWMAELGRFSPDLKVDRQDVIVTSYGTLVRDLAFHLQREYRLIVADEASLLRNPDAEASKALCKLRTRGRIALTGTPVENRMQDLWSIFRFIAPGYLGDRAHFKERYEGAAADRVPPALLERLRLRVSPFVLRRTKGQVAKELPDKVEIDEWLTLPDDQASLYSSLAQAGLEEVERIRDRQGEGASRMHLLTLLLRLRQICVDPGLLDLADQKVSSAVKIERLIELLSERSENGCKTLVFSQFARNLRRIENRISQGFGRVFCIDGSTRKRQELVDAFQSEPGPAVFLISLKAGGYGLNLTAADAVVHLDPWWNPAVEAQASDRAHRIGQTRPVTVYRLLTLDTVEERVRRMQERKRAVIDAATGEPDSIPRNWSREDLEDLLR
jgi:superfamily II DNA or RNA helicase